MQQVQDNDFGVNKFPYFKQILGLMRYSNPYEIYLGLTEIFALSISDTKYFL